MTSWMHPRLLCLSDLDAVAARCDCGRKSHLHAAAFRAELVNAATGEVHRQTLCFDRGKIFADSHHLEFPPWRDQDERA